jgi:hypothetical protein
MDVITELDLSWMAAIVGFKGRISRKKNKMRATPQLVLWVQMANHQIASRMCEMTGTHPEPASSVMSTWDRRGCIEHCPEAHVHISEVIMPLTTKWSVTGTAAAIVLYNLMPYIVSDNTDSLRTVMEECLANATLAGPGSGATRQAAVRLAEKGWKLPPVVLRAFSDSAIENLLARSDMIF